MPCSPQASTCGRRTAAVSPRSRSARASRTRLLRCSLRRSSRRPWSRSISISAFVTKRSTCRWRWHDEVLAVSGFARVVDPADAREAAQHILSGRQYRSSPTPRPLRKQLSWLGDRLHKPLDWIGNALSHVPRLLLIAIAVAAVGLAIAFIV